MHDIIYLGGNMAKKKNKNNIRVKRYLFIILMVISLIFLGLFGYVNVLPLPYFIMICVLIVIIDILLFRGLLNTKKKKPVSIILSSLSIIIYLIGILYLFPTARFLSGLGLCDVVEYNYVVLVSNDSKIAKIKDLRNAKVSFIGDDGKIINKINKKLDTKVISEDDVLEVINKLTNNDVEALVIEKNYLDIIKEENKEYLINLKEKINFKITIVNNNLGKKNNNLVKKPFNVLITGIDTTGKVNSVARSDVNILVTVNPKTNDIVLTSIPRDYYVEIKEGKTKDKLTHSGIYGVDVTEYAVSNLLDVPIDYYVKVNFTSLVKIVDTLGGIDVYSDTNFKSGTYEYNDVSFKFTEGINHMDGKKALAFARERKAFNDGDRRRGVHQQAIIEALIKKVTEPKIIVKYNALLSALSDSFITDLDHNDVSKLIKKQIKHNKSWKITNVYLTGSDSYEKTYSYGNQKLYVMVPDKDSVNDASNTIKKIMEKQ